MLKSTYRATAPQPVAAEAALPVGWTEHKAPTGHTYYHNASSGQSTYTRPAPPSDEPLQIDYGAVEPDQVMRASMQVMEKFNQSAGPQPGHFTGGRNYQDHSRRRGNQGDRPKSKALIPDCAPWTLVKTKLGRRFVHNTETKQSLWKFPQDVMMKVIEMDRMEWEAKKRREETSSMTQEMGDLKTSQPANEVEMTEATVAPKPSGATNGPQDDDSDSYEEIEVTDDEAGEDGDESPKRPRLAEDDEAAPPSGPVEFDEDDIAWQLAQMEGEADIDDDGNSGPDFARPNDEEDEEDQGLPLTEQDNIALFRSLLDHSGISPYSTFEKLVEDHHVVEDARYVSLSTVSARKEAFSHWSRDRIAEHTAQKQVSGAAKEKDPKVKYLRFLQKNATPKLYWPEFRRKFKRATEMTDRKLQDKDREKLYRDLVGRLKSSDAERKKELVGLLKDTMRKERDRFQKDMPLEELPETILRDVRFYVLDGAQRDELVQTFLETS